MKCVSGIEPEKRRGIVRGYTRLRVLGQHYPGVIPQEGSSVHGIVYHDISSGGWERLDRFEGEMYFRQLVAVEFEDGSGTDAYIYEVKKDHRNQLAATGWSFEEFLQKGKKTFVDSYRGYGEID